MAAGERPAARRGEQPLTHMAAAAVQGDDGSNADGYRDYRGVPVVGAWQWLEDYDFGVATEMDLDEAFAPVYILRRAFAVLMGLLLAAAIGGVLATWLVRRQRRALHGAPMAGQQFGQYTLLEKLGTGGMGTVYKARHALLRRPTAVKLLKAEMMSDTAIARFEREVQLTSGLTHPNTVAVFDYGRTPEGVFYYAMEYLEGVNLDELVKRHGPLTDERAVFILRQVCASLAEAHAAGLIHRDVKPGNIVLTVRGGQHDFVKVLDFGLAKTAVASEEATLTSTNIVAGTPLYVSPEAVTEPERMDARADVYAIGAVGYFLVTGWPVFAGSSVADICLMHVTAAPQPPSARAMRPVSPDLEAILLRCLAKSPSDRPDDAGALLRLLESCPVSGHWTAAHAADWWADRTWEHSAAARHSSAAVGVADVSGKQ
jgi:serine/threonine protein kinase